VIFDTNALSAFIEGDAAIGRILATQGRACLPVIALGEFLYGIAHSRQREAYEAWLRSHLAWFELLPVAEATAATYASIRVALRRNGTPIPANDAWIGAIAIEHRLPVLSRDAHFDAIPQVERVDW
jgi:predicted nucleic acid-binding protein